MTNERLNSDENEVVRLRSKLRRANDKYRVAMEQDRAIKDRLAQLESRLDALQREVALRSDIERELVQDLVSARVALANLRSGRAVTLSRALRKARSARKAIQLPATVIRVIRERKRHPSEQDMQALVKRELDAHKAKIAAALGRSLIHL